MATVTLTEGYFHLSTDLTNFINIPINAIQSIEKQSAGEVVIGVTGRRRIVTRPGLASTYTFTLTMVDIAKLEQFRNFTNLELLYRGPRGRKFYGFIPSLSLSDTPGPTDKTRNVSFTMQDITKMDAADT